MDFLYPDVDRSLLTSIDFLEGEVIYYASRRHWVEVLPEAITVFWTWITVVALWLNFPWIATPIRLGAGLAISAPVVVLIWLMGWLMVEVFRWSRDICVLTNYNYIRQEWQLWPVVGLHRRRRRFLINTEVYQPLMWRLVGFDVGRVWSKDIAESYATEPLMPKPFDLQKRMEEATHYDGASSDKLDWRL